MFDWRVDALHRVLMMLDPGTTQWRLVAEWRGALMRQQYEWDDPISVVTDLVW